MSESALIGIDLGKHTFHLHGQDKSGREVFRKKCSRAQMMQFLASSQSCVVAMEACAGSHCVARQLAAIGHTPKLISPQFVKPFVKGNKNDFVDAEAICEAASRTSMRFVTPRLNPSKPFLYSIGCANRWCVIAPEPLIRCTVFYWNLASACPEVWPS